MMKTFQLLFRLFFGTAAVVLLVVSVWWLFFSVDGNKAYINGTLTTLNAPIDGTISLPKLTPTDPISAGERIGEITNPRAAQIEFEYAKARSEHLQAQLRHTSLQVSLQEMQEQLAETLVRVASETKLNVQLVQGDIERTKHELEALKASARTAGDKWRRVSDPRVRGALSQNELVEAQGAKDSANALVTAKQAELTAQTSRLDAAKHGWDAQVRQRTYSFNEKVKLEREVKELQREIGETALQVKQLAARLESAEQQLNLAKAAPLTSPIAGCIWSVDRRDGSVVKAADTVVQILNPEDRWVEAFVPESQADRLNVGDKAEIKVPGQRQTWFAYIEGVRSGGGRVITGQDVAYPPPERVRKEVAVRLRFDAEAPHFSAQDFYGVGKAVTVDFAGAGSLSGWLSLVGESVQTKLHAVAVFGSEFATAMSLDGTMNSSFSVSANIAFLFAGMVFGSLFRSLKTKTSATASFVEAYAGAGSSLSIQTVPPRTSTIFNASTTLSAPERLFREPPVSSTSPSASVRQDHEGTKKFAKTKRKSRPHKGGKRK
ncbi:HlyD family efflux transporter periplasmic adaptor subunit [bacterium]|nr:HlyD family efflux transporter periplasmic adaptor subunit [bacterium]MBP9809983.1 HlyD family efflux transporter periplasmic adaptor subunit [bacterium]